MLEKFDGGILDAGDTLRFIKFTILNTDSAFKEYSTSQHKEFFNNKSELRNTTLHASSLDELIAVGKDHNLKFISVNQNGINDMWYPYLSEIYLNHSEYSFLNKVLDTKELGFKKFHVKVFEIDYDKLKLSIP